jgi:hypothetical protein
MMATMGRGTRAAGARRHGAAPAAPAAAPRGVRAPRKSGRGATFSVLTMTLAALAGVGILAAQAEATAPHASANGTAKASSTSKTSTSTTTLPAHSGSGTRIVYSPSRHRVWLVQGSTVSRTMQVVPGTVTPPAGTYPVYAKSPGSTGGDGKSVVYLVRFDSASSTVFGFDALAGVTGMPGAPTGRTGGVRMEQVDAQVLYQFAAVGTNVVVI